MTIKNNQKILSVITAAAVLYAMFGFVTFIHANPSSYANTAQTSSATTSPAYLVPGVATSTLVFDSYANARNTAADRAAMGVQFIGSSTASTYNIAFEYSNGAPGLDCVTTPTSCDWYKDDLLAAVTATTTQPYSINLPISFAFAMASSSQGGAGASDNRALRMVTVPTPARYIRAIFTITGANGSVWAQIVPVKQNN